MVLVDPDEARLTSEDCGELIVFVEFSRSVEDLAGENELAQLFLDDCPVGSDYGIDLGCLPKLVWLNFEDILVDD